MSSALKGNTIQLSVDETEKQELLEIQTELNESRMAHEDVKNTLTRLKKQMNQVKMNRKNIDSLKSHQSTWIAIGKTFVKKKRSDIIGLMDSDLAKIEKRIGEIELREQGIMQKMKERQKRFDDFVESHRVKVTSDSAIAET